MGCDLQGTHPLSSQNLSHKPRFRNPEAVAPIHKSHRTGQGVPTEIRGRIQPDFRGNKKGAVWRKEAVEFWTWTTSAR